MTSKELVKQTLEKWRFPVLKEEENALLFRYQMKYIQIGSLQEDSHGISVTLANVFRCDDEREMRLALKTCNELNYRMMQVKLYIDEDNDLIIASEFFYNNDDDVEYYLNISLEVIVAAKKRFLKQYQEFEDEDEMMHQLAQGN